MSATAKRRERSRKVSDLTTSVSLSPSAFVGLFAVGSEGEESEWRRVE